ncbi:hypothetical protein V1508DRAFT_400949 [Lipomyces doorenjongii]|uniref:uncharacterized protein n=1 Tax=Lipomyces doorenjongii TaxID=383834 RepID=UPI0034CDA6FF
MAQRLLNWVQITFITASRQPAAVSPTGTDSPAFRIRRIRRIRSSVVGVDHYTPQALPNSYKRLRSTRTIFRCNDTFRDIEDEDEEEWAGLDDGGPQPPALSMPPPPETVYLDVDTAKKSRQAWARNHGYAIRIQRSKARKNGNISKVFLHCDRGGQYTSRHHDESTRQRHLTDSYKTNCPFSVVVTESNGNWEVKFETLSTIMTRQATTTRTQFIDVTILKETVFTI